MGTVANAFQEKLFVKLETTFDDFPDSLITGIGSGDAMDSLEGMEFGIEQETRRDTTRNGTRSTIEMTKLRKNGTFSVPKMARPSGTAGTAPQENTWLEAAFGNASNSPGVSQDYSLISTVRKSLSAYIFRGHFGEFHTGMAINEWEFVFTGSDECKWTFSGEHADDAKAGTDALEGAVTSDVTTFSVADGHNYTVDARATIESEQVRITAIDFTNNELTVTRGYGGTTNVTHAISIAVSPLNPTHSFSGATLPGTKGTLSIAGTDIEVIEGSIKGTENIKMFNDEVGFDKATGFTDKVREVTGTFSMRLYQDQFFLLQNFRQFDNLALVLTLGDTAGDKILFTMPICKGRIVGTPAPGDEEVIVEMVFDAIGSGGDDEITVSYQ